MRLRSLLFVPGDRPDRFDKALTSGADALILDLEDSVVAGRKDAAREAAAAFLNARHAARIFVRVNPLDSEWIDGDATVARAADGVMLPKAEGAASVRALADRLGTDAPPILPIATETPRARFALGEYADVAARVRALTLFGAHAAGVAAIETVYPAIADLDGLARYAAAGARDGFTGMMAIHPVQVDPMNRAFTPSDEAIAAAQRIVDAFAADPGAGALQLDGRMIDAPHLKQAQAILARAAD